MRQMLPQHPHISLTTHTCVAFSYMHTCSTLLTQHYCKHVFSTDPSGVRCVHSTRMATVISGPWPRAHLHDPANTYYQARPGITIAPSLVTRHWCRVPSVHGTCYPVLAWSIQLLAYAMPSVPVPPITLVTDMVARCRLLAAHGPRSCLSVRTQPLTAPLVRLHRPLPYHAMPYHTIPW